MDNNPNYYAQYRSFGRMVLAGKKITFQDVFGPQVKQMDFELRFFRQNLQNGYRVELCSWDWSSKFTDRLTGDRTITANVRADYGWQPSGLTVQSGTSYSYEAEGKWQPGEKADAVDADGAADGRGRLAGVLMKDYQLVEEFVLGKAGAFTPSADGDLYLRCRVPWKEIAGNSGKISVRLKNK